MNRGTTTKNNNAKSSLFLDSFEGSIILWSNIDKCTYLRKCTSNPSMSPNLIASWQISVYKIKFIIRLITYNYYLKIRGKKIICNKRKKQTQECYSCKYTIFLRFLLLLYKQNFISWIFFLCAHYLIQFFKYLMLVPQWFRLLHPIFRLFIISKYKNYKIICFFIKPIFGFQI